jgi:hypothetical protein
MSFEGNHEPRFERVARRTIRVRIDDIVDNAPYNTPVAKRRYIDIEAGYGERLRMRNAIARVINEQALVERKARA